MEKFNVVANWYETITLVRVKQHGLGQVTLILRMKGSYAVLRNEQQNSYSASRASMALWLLQWNTRRERRQLRVLHATEYWYGIAAQRSVTGLDGHNDVARAGHPLK